MISPTTYMSGTSKGTTRAVFYVRTYVITHGWRRVGFFSNIHAYRTWTSKQRSRQRASDQETTLLLRLLYLISNDVITREKCRLLTCETIFQA